MPRFALLLLGLLLTASCADPPNSDDDDDATDPVSDDDDSGTEPDDDDTTPPPDDDDATPDPCDEPPPDDLCQGICTGYEPTCGPDGWSCAGVPGFEPEEVSCDGFDNDCDGEVDEGDICPDCEYRLDEIEANLHAMWDLDFDFECNTYLTTNISGPDYTTMVPEDPAESTVTWYGNANQNMGFALVDPDPSNQRVVVTYQCCPSCGCLAQNGLTLLYTCTPDDPGCGCIGQSNCPGFLDVPFLAAGQEDTNFTYSNFFYSTPTGLAVGPRNSYYVGNWRPATCSTEADCTECSPDDPTAVCSPGQPACCDTTALGRLAQFTLPTASGGEPTFRVVSLLEGEEILGLAAGRDTSVMIGTRVSDTEGRLYRYDPFSETTTLLSTWPAPVYSVTQVRWTGQWFIAVDTSPQLHLLTEDGLTELFLPPDVPADPTGQGVLQWAPDGKLYRLIGGLDSLGTLEVYELP